MSSHGSWYRWETMKRGDVRFIADGNRAAISSALSHWRRRHPGWLFKCRTVEGGVQVTREL